MFRTLPGRLSLLLLALFVPLAVFYVLSTVSTSRRYAQEVTQKVNTRLAARLVREHHLMVGQDVDTAALMDVVETLAMTNPGVDLYILNPEGRIIEASLPEQNLERQQVSLTPIQRFLNGAAYPILGDNPRLAARPKVFSVAPIPSQGPPGGYLYIILVDAAQDSVASMVESSTIVWLSLWAGIALLLVVFLGGTLAFTLFTRRLKRLTKAMMQFEAEGFSGEVLPPGTLYPRGDEVADLERVFHGMVAKIADQVATLKETDALRRELVANVSHDLRTPLTALQGYLETLQLETLGPEEKRLYLERATQHGAQLSTLISELFELAKLEAHAAAIEKEELPLAELVQDVVQKFALEAERRGVTLQSDVRSYPVVQADVGFLERVLENLLRNALEHTPAGGNVTLALLPMVGRVKVEVQDSGVGIPPEELPAIFERYYQVPRVAQTEEKRGAGLGLAISQRMLELHGSQLEVESRVGVGSTFRFTLPMRPPH